jgi:DNA polymerase-3 subunit gamma/tau
MIQNDLANRYRPKKLDQVVGQDSNVQALKAWIRENKVPHVLVMVGPSGTGKSSCAQLMAEHLTRKAGPEDGNILIVDSADNRGIDDIRDIKASVAVKALNQEPWVVIIEEAVQLPEASQQALLLTLEKPPDWAYFIVCTTRLGKLLNTFTSRCRKLEFLPVPWQAIRSRLTAVCDDLQEEVPGSILNTIANTCDGNLREALSMLEKILTLQGNEKAQLDAISSPVDDRSDIAELCRLLMKRGISWPSVLAILSKIPDPRESVRIRVLAYCNKAGRGDNPEAIRVGKCFMADYSQSGDFGLLESCWTAWLSGKVK